MRLAIVSLVAFFGAANAASAQVLAVDPDGDLTDYDEAKENYSEFWERALSPAAGTYEDLVAQAVATINRKKGLDDARTLLSDAIAARPDAPLAHFWLGFLEKQSGNYAECAASLGEVRRIEPTFRAPPNSDRLPSGWQLNYDLGMCLALSGNYSDALERFDAIMSRFQSCTVKRSADCYHWQVPWRHGETLMALGRLEEAIATLAGTGSGALQIQYTLAVALERDEQLAKAQDALSKATSADRGLRALTSSSRHYIPATDEYYYRGLARKARRENAHAKLFFAEFAKRAKDSPWRARAKAHVEEAEADVAKSALVETGGSMLMDPAAKALSKGYASMQKCTAGFPAQLFLVRVHQSLVAIEGKRNRTKTVRSVTIQHYDPLAKRRLSTDIIKITRCLRAAAGSMTLPKLKGAAGTSGYMSFYVGG